MSSDVLVTVGLPIYNQRETIVRCVRSVNEQDLRVPIELIIVDDGSVDGGVERLDLSKYEHLQIRVFRLNPNQGASVARNVVLREARGDYLGWIDADDIWYPHKLRVHMDHLASLGNAQVLSISSFDWVEPNGATRTYVPRLSSDPLRDLLGNQVGAYVWSTFGRTEYFRSVGFFDPALRRLQDLDFMIRYAAGGGFLASSGGEPLSCYNKDHARGVSAEVHHCAMRIVQKHRSLLNKYGRKFRRRVTLHHLRNATRFAKADRNYLRYYLTRLQEQALRWRYSLSR